MLGEINNLSDVIGIVSHLAVNRLHHGVSFRAYVGGAGEISVREGSERLESKLPSGFPEGEKFVASFRRGFEFRIAIAIRLLAIAGKKIRPARADVSRKMF